MLTQQATDMRTASQKLQILQYYLFLWLQNESWDLETFKDATPKATSQQLHPQKIRQVVIICQICIKFSPSLISSFGTSLQEQLSADREHREQYHKSKQQTSLLEQAIQSPLMGEEKTCVATKRRTRFLHRRKCKQVKKIFLLPWEGTFLISQVLGKWRSCYAKEIRIMDKLPLQHS